ncbi:MAG: hypothetical protein AAFY15_07265 [Cyanobacteria bacterium J06648_11]
MTLTLDLTPELEQFLIQEARHHGLSVERVALQLLEDSTAVRRRQLEAVDLLQSWIDDEDAEDQTDVAEYLMRKLDEDRLSDRKLFPSEMKGVTW